MAREDRKETDVIVATETGVEDAETLLRRILLEKEAILQIDATRFPEGFQYGVSAQSLSALTLDAQGDTSNPTVPIPLANFRPNPDILLAQNLGLLNVTGYGSGNALFDFHSSSGGQDFQVRVGETLIVEGIPKDVACIALSGLLATLEAGRVDDPSLIFLNGVKRNLAFFDREGHWKTSRTREVRLN